MLVYHGTQELVLDAVWERGLEPRGERPTRWTALPSRPDLVYLTNYGHFFYGRESQRISVVEIDLVSLDASLLLPDEDFLHQTEGIPIDEARRILEEHRDRWKESLDTFGTCAYKGVISPASIRQTCSIDLTRMDVLMRWYGHGVEIDETGINKFQTKGPIIRQVTDWVFKHVDELPPEIKWNSADRTFITLQATPARDNP